MTARHGQSIDYERIDRVALSNARELAPEIVPDGHFEGNNYVARNPTRDDKNAGSFSFNVTNGMWAEFAGAGKKESGRGLISYKAYAHQLEPHKSAMALAERLKIDPYKGKGSRPTGTINGPSDANNERAPSTKARKRASKSDLKLAPTHDREEAISGMHAVLKSAYAKLTKDLGSHTSNYAYRTIDGAHICTIVRWEYVDEDGNRQKTFRPITRYQEGASEPQYLPKPPPNGQLPFYNLPDFARLPDAEIWVHEGEKCADQGKRDHPNVIHTTPMNGSRNALNADYRSFKGRKVRIIPDNNEAGTSFCDDVAKSSIDAGATWVKVAKPPEDVPEKWDWAWARENGWTTEALVEWSGKATTWVDTSWEEPEPFDSAPAPEPFPLDALPKVIRNAVASYQAFGQQPLSLVVSSALSAASLVCQGLVNVSRSSGLVGPISLAFLIVAESGERKTAADKQFRRAIRAWSKMYKDEHHKEIKEAEARFRIWEQEKEGLLARIKAMSGKTLKKGDDDGPSVDDLKGSLIEMEKNPPIIPPLPTLFMEDATPEGLSVGLGRGWPSSSVWSDEAGMVVGSHALTENSAMRYLALLNRLWDGNETIFRRATRSIEIRGRRLTVSLMGQPKIIGELIHGNDGLARSIGLLARFLIDFPKSTRGSRPFAEGDLDSAELRAFDNRIHEILQLPLPFSEDDDFSLDPPVLELEPEAFALWRRLHDAIENELGETGEFAEMADIAAKAAEQIVRIAAIFHIFDNGPSGKIDGDTMSRAGKVGLWYLTEARRSLGLMDEAPGVADAKLMLDWLMSLPEPPSLKTMAQKAPYRLRDRDARNAALEYLVEAGWIRKEPRGRSTVAVINPLAEQ